MTQVEAIAAGRYSFWYEGENLLDTPTQDVIGYEDVHLFEVERPCIEDHAFNEIYTHEGPESALRELNRRIAYYLVKEFQRQKESLPQSYISLYLEKIELFYTWFWRNNKGGGKSIPAFLKEFNKTKDHSDKRRWFNVRQAGDYLGCSSSLIRKAIREGKLKAKRHDPDSEKSTYSIHRKNLDGYMMFQKAKLTRPQMEELDWLNK